MKKWKKVPNEPEWKLKLTDNTRLEINDYSHDGTFFCMIIHDYKILFSVDEIKTLKEAKEQVEQRLVDLSKSLIMALKELTR